MKCAGCGKTILLTYVKAMRKTWHAECFRCAGCGKPIIGTTYKVKNGKPFHIPCYQKAYAPICPTCGEPVTGAYIQALRHMYHPEHFICTACHQPIRSRGFYTHDGKPYCRVDYVQLFSPHCSVCNEPITGRYHLDASGNKVCSKRDKDHRLCSSCGKILVTAHGFEGAIFKDGRSICKQCAMSAVTKPVEAGRVFGEVCQTLQKVGIEISCQQIPLKLVSMTTLRHSYGNKSQQRPYGLTQVKETTVFGMTASRQVSAILVLNNLPEVHLGMVLAHEAMHVWLVLNGFPHCTARVEEGLCELVGALWLERQPDPLAEHLLKNIEQNHSRIYGSGYRAARKAYDKMGLQNLLLYVRQNQKLPA
ncbi:MAG: protein DA1 [Anaerolineaceae bacterium]